MKVTTVALTIGLSLGAQIARADAGFYDEALVRGVTPEYERVNVPSRECRSEYIPGNYRRRESGSLLGPVIGGVAGGLLGAQIGRGNGRTAAAAAGAAIGALTGDRLSRRDDGYDRGGREVQRCVETDRWERRVVGYRVAYEYGGRSYDTVMPYDPGARLRVHVNVDPVGGDD
ncbi:MAG: glycine zipper 2TM domain-containing protein [Betaproteobacteria bacterium]